MSAALQVSAIFPLQIPILPQTSALLPWQIRAISGVFLDLWNSSLAIRTIEIFLPPIFQDHSISTIRTRWQSVGLWAPKPIWKAPDNQALKLLQRMLQSALRFRFWVLMHPL